jgi:hypothetical protein
MDKQVSQYRMSQSDLAAWGVDDIAYVKPVDQDGRTMYSVHAADGTQMGVMANREVAFAAVRQHDMEPVSVH